MATSKEKITFYASEKVARWYNKLPPGTGTQEINRILEEAISKPKGPTLEERVRKLEAERRLIVMGDMEYKENCDCCRVVTELSESCYSNTGELLNSVSHIEKRDGVEYAIGVWQYCRQHN